MSNLQSLFVCLEKYSATFHSSVYVGEILKEKKIHVEYLKRI